MKETYYDVQIIDTTGKIYDVEYATISNGSVEYEQHNRYYVVSINNIRSLSAKDKK